MSESVNKNLGHATAYGYAKAKGYTGTEEEFAELMASYGTVAQAAAASASAAAQAKTDAEAALEAAEEAEAGAKEAKRSVDDKALTVIQDIETAGAEQTAGIQQAGADQVNAVETAGSEQAAAVEQKGEQVRQSIPSDYTELSEDVGVLKSAINFNNLYAHDTGNEISTKDGFWVGDYGTLNTSTARGYLIIPLENIYINGVATLKSGRLGFYQSTVFAMAYLDKDFHIISAIYQDIIAPHTFSSNDIPSGTVYVAFNSYSTANPHVMATFSFQSTDTKLGTVSDKIEDVYEATTQYACSEVSLSYEAATGYYASNKSFNTFSGVTVAKVSVTEGQKYLLTTRNYYNAAIACLLDANDAVDSVVYVANNTNPVKDYEITIPGNVSKLMIQRFYTYEPTKLKLITGIKAKGVKSLLNGKRVTVIGDSITERNSRAKTNWALWLTDWCGAVIQNLGASGTGFIAGGSSSYSNRIASISNPDIIGVAVSFNDMSNTIEDLTTAAESFFDDLIMAYPTTPIICYVQSPWSAYHYGVEKSDQWIAAVKDICATCGVPFYGDMYNGTVLKPWIAANRAVYYINDGDGNTGEEDWVHPNSEGHKTIARYLYPKFAENLVAVGLDYGID